MVQVLGQRSLALGHDLLESVNFLPTFGGSHFFNRPFEVSRFFLSDL